jgi:hypothetical protein
VARTVPDPSVHVFLGGVPDDLVTIQAMLATMPMCTYGQVVIESTDELPLLDLPRRVQVRRVPPVSDAFGDITVGEGVARAADAWLDEWMPEDAAEKPCSFHAWIGCEGSPAARAAAARVDHSLRAGLSGS